MNRRDKIRRTAFNHKPPTTCPTPTMCPLPSVTRRSKTKRITFTTEGAFFCLFFIAIELSQQIISDFITCLRNDISANKIQIFERKTLIIHVKIIKIDLSFLSDTDQKKTYFKVTKILKHFIAVTNFYIDFI